MKKIYCIIFVLFALTSCELERVNPFDENASDEIKNTNVKILDYSIVQEEVADNKIGRNETVYLKVRVKNYGGLYADGINASFSLISCKGIWYEISSIYTTYGFRLSGNSIDYLMLPGTFNNYTFKFKAPNQASTEKLLVTFTENTGKKTYDYLLVDVQ
jgi:hypothetical protein